MGMDIDVIAGYGFYVKEENVKDIQVFFDIETEDWDNKIYNGEIFCITNDLYKVEHGGSALSGEEWFYIVLRDSSVDGLYDRITEFKNILIDKKLEYKIELIKDFWES